MRVVVCFMVFLVSKSQEVETQEPLTHDRSAGPQHDLLGAGKEGRQTFTEAGSPSWPPGHCNLQEVETFSFPMGRPELGPGKRFLAFSRVVSGPSPLSSLPRHCTQHLQPRILSPWKGAYFRPRKTRCLESHTRSVSESQDP